MSTVLKGEFKLKENTDKKQMEIEGFANKAVTDRIGDLIPKEAWELDNFIKNPIIFFNHDSEHPIGKAIKVEPHEDGLKIKIRLSRTKEGKVPYVRDLISEGILRSFSVGFDDHGSSEKNSDGINVIKRAELIETSVVCVPMNQDSLFTVVGGGEKSGKRTYTKQAYNCKSHNCRMYNILAIIISLSNAENPYSRPNEENIDKFPKPITLPLKYSIITIKGILA